MKPLLFPRDLLRFLYWVFFKPFTLDRYIRQIDPTLGKNIDLYALWKRSKEYSEFRQIIYLAFFQILIACPVALFFAIMIAFASFFVGFEVNWVLLIYSVVFITISGAIFCAALGAVNMVLGVAGGVMIVLIIGVGVAVEAGISLSHFLNFQTGISRDAIYLGTGIVAAIVALGITTSTDINIMNVMARMMFGVVVSFMIGVVFAMGFGVIGGVTIGVFCSMFFGIFSFRLGNYIVEALYSFLLTRFFVRKDFRFSPVMWDEFIWLPLPGLDKQLISIGKKNREEGMQAIAYVAGAFRQGWAARRALLELTAYDVQNSKNLEAVAAISETLSWLPPETRAAYKSLLLGLETVSRNAKAALESDTLYNRQEQLKFALNETQSMRQGFAYDANQQIPRLMSPALEVWETLLADELAAAQKQEAIPNVYVAGRPLDTKSKVFRGRRDVFMLLEQELISPAEQRPAILLFGARRTGKTSVLRQLPETLGPQVIPVAVDLQDAALEKDVAGLLYKIAEKIRSDALLFRRFEFGELSRVALDANPYSAFADWLQKLQETIGERWILLNLDEYEYLEKMLNDGRVDDRIFQMLRTLLQNHASLTLLLSGAHTFEDLSPIWSHHLINARVIKINPLNEDEARELITKPIANYPLVYTEGAVKDMLEATACQPYLIQAVCRDLVNMKNDTHHFHANSKDVLKALESVLVSATAYFQDLWEGPDTDQAQQTVMGAIAKARGGSLSLTELNAVLKKAGFEQTAKVRQRALRVLEHRDILKSNKTGWSFQIPLVRTWIRIKQFGLKK